MSPSRWFGELAEKRSGNFEFPNTPPERMIRSHSLHAFGLDDILNTLGGSITLHCGQHSIALAGSIRLHSVAELIASGTSVTDAPGCPSDQGK